MVVQNTYERNGVIERPDCFSALQRSFNGHHVGADFPHYFPEKIYFLQSPDFNYKHMFWFFFCHTTHWMNAAITILVYISPQ